MDESCYINESVLLNYFAGELPADRRKEVEEWIAASEDNEKMARDIFRLYRAADTLDYMNRVDASAALQQVKGRIHKHRHRISWMVWGQRNNARCGGGSCGARNMARRRFRRH